MLYSLNLSEGYSPVIMAKPLKFKQFDFLGGEPHIQIEPFEQRWNESNLVITSRFNSPKDLLMILLAKDAVDRMEIFDKITLVLPYFPAARQDRVCNEGEPLSVKVFANMINGCEFDMVVILAPHSEVTPALLNKCKVCDETTMVEKIIAGAAGDLEEWNIVCPDAGAGKRVGNVVKHLVKKFPEKSFNLIRCEKVRDVATGELKEFHVQANDLNGLPTLIVDDILANGGTFIGLGDELRKKNCGKLCLYTSHADCLAGIEKMTAYFDHYITTDSKNNWNELVTAENFICIKFQIENE